MNKIIILIVMFFVTEVMAVCNEPISRTNFSPLTVLTSTKLNTDINDAYTRLNELPGDCITDSTVTSAKILDGTIVNTDISAVAAIERTKLAPLNYVISSGGSGSYSTSSGTYADVTNLSVSITTTGGPIEAYLINEDNSSESFVQVSTNSGTDIGGALKLVRNGVDVSLYPVSASGATSAMGAVFPPSLFRFFEAPAAGTYTYKIQARATTTLQVVKCKLVVREL